MASLKHGPPGLKKVATAGATKPQREAASQSGEGYRFQGETKKVPTTSSSAQPPAPLPLGQGANAATAQQTYSQAVRDPPQNQSAPLTAYQRNNIPPPPAGRSPYPPLPSRAPTAVRQPNHQLPVDELLRQLSLHYPGVPLPTFPTHTTSTATMQLPVISPTTAQTPPSPVRALPSQQRPLFTHIDCQPSTSAAAAAATAALAAPTAATAAIRPLIDIDREMLNRHREGYTKKEIERIICSDFQSYSPPPSPTKQPKPLPPIKLNKTPTRRPPLPPPAPVAMPPTPPSPQPSPPPSTSDYTPPSSPTYSNSSCDSPYPAEDEPMLDAPYVMPRIWDLTYAKEEGITGHTEGRTLPISSSEAKEHLDWTKAHPGGRCS